VPQVSTKLTPILPQVTSIEAQLAAMMQSGVTAKFSPVHANFTTIQAQLPPL